ncbi:MAG: cyclodeaminase/cyclohydrolase family protein [Candidatus Omnitrophota bacterium]
MKTYSKLTIEKYLNELAAKTPVPGGGSAAALLGAIGCALCEMVLNYSHGRKASRMLAAVKNNRIMFTGLIDKDARVYARLLASIKKYGRDNYKTQSAFKMAALTPLEICDRSYEAAAAISGLPSIANRNLMSDVGCAAAANKACFKAARLNVEINLKYINDKNFVNSKRKKLIWLSKRIRQWQR